MPKISSDSLPITYSHYLARLLEKDPTFLAFLETASLTPFSAEKMAEDLASENIEEEAQLKRALRSLRQKVMGTVIVRDLFGWASLAEVMQTMSDLADMSLNIALDYAHRHFALQFGEPLDDKGMAQKLMIMGMGKLGGQELNVSSDIDLIFIYPQSGFTAGSSTGRKIEVFDFFTRVGKKVIALIDDHNEDGQVFRVDMRLRPNGDSGPLVTSIAALETYFLVQGREWERYAWIRARLVNTGENCQSAWAKTLHETVRPFVFRKYLDFGAIDAMSALHAQIRKEVSQKGMADHIKLGRGGIREIEFIAQVFQLIRGGRLLALQAIPTLAILKVIASEALLPKQTVFHLNAAYDFLRRLEHRLQYRDDAQTHTLPHDLSEKIALAQSMGFERCSDFDAVLEGHRTHVSDSFDAIFSDKEQKEEKTKRTPYQSLWESQTEDSHRLLSLAKTLGFSSPKLALSQMAQFRQSAKYRELPESTLTRLDAIFPALIEAAAKSGSPNLALERLLKLIETIARRASYLSLLAQHPHALLALAKIMGASQWASDYLIAHPILLDELIDARLYETKRALFVFKAEVRASLATVAGDTEREMDVMREAHHAEVFRLLAQDIAGLYTVEHLADELSALADAVLEISLELCWEKLKHRHPRPDLAPKIAIIAYGKLGGKELSYGSDLDLVFLHDDPDPKGAEVLARLVQRLNTWLSSQTSAGALFVTDFRLRPDGDAGMLISSIEAFEAYQKTKAWVWEHQALSRARFCAGDPALGARFEAIRYEILMVQRNVNALKQEVSNMRDKIQKEHVKTRADVFDLKYDIGGLLDVEFIVQTMVLAYAKWHPVLCKNLGNLALLRIASEQASLPKHLTEPAMEAYRRYRKAQHALRLAGIENAVLPKKEWESDIQAVRVLWKSLFDVLP